MKTLLATVAAAILAAGVLVTAGPVAAVPPTPPPADAPAYYPSGPQYDVAVTTLESQGWTRCFQEPYTNDSTTVASLQAMCDGDYLIITGRPNGSSTLTILAAAPRADVFTVTPENEPRPVNGSYWYFTPIEDGNAQSMGFSTDATIQQNSCDYEEGPVAGGLCWHIVNNENPRLGDGYSMDGEETYEGYIREAYEADAATSGDYIFKITSLSPTALYAVDTEEQIEDVRGGIGFCADNVLYRGDDGIGVYDIDDFSGGSIDSDSDEDWADLYATDILTKKAWAFTTWDDGSNSLSEITEIDCATGTLTDNVIALDPAIEYTEYGDGRGIEFGVFAGYGRIAIADNVSGRIYDIDLPSGAVSLAATVDPETSPYFQDREDIEGYSVPGVVEYFGGAIHLVYPVRQVGPDTIQRMNVLTEANEIVFNVPEGSNPEWAYHIGDDPSFVVDCGNSRWYLGHEYGDETPWVYDELPETEAYAEPLTAFAAECLIQPIGTDQNCGDVDLTVCPTIMPSATGLIGAPGTSHVANRATYTWLRCVTPGTAVPGPRPPSGCRTIRTFKATGAQMAVRPYGVTARDAKAGYIRLAVKVGTRTYYSGAYSVAP